MTLTILLIGSGGREHAIAKSIKSSKRSTRLFCIGHNNNPGIKSLCSDNAYIVNNNLSNWTETDILYISKLNIEFKFDLAIIGPEAPLGAGLADQLRLLDIPVVGPGKEYAQIETSKIFARELMSDYTLLSEACPRNYSVTFPDNIGNSLEDHMIELQFPDGFAIKYDGLKGGKGVLVSGVDSDADIEKYMNELYSIQENFIVEEKLTGDEFSLISISDGTNNINSIRHFPVVKDFKRLLDGDLGPNTGGMGCISYWDGKLPFLTDSDLQLAQKINSRVIEILNMKFGGEGYKGILYGGFMKSQVTYGSNKQRIKVIEFNCRFGDPEAINLLHLLGDGNGGPDFLEICLNVANGTLSEMGEIKFAKENSICKYLVPNGYPYSYPECKNNEQYIDLSNLYNIDSFIIDDHIIFSGIENTSDNFIKKMNGSRALAVVCKGDNYITTTISDIIEVISGSVHFRKDLGDLQFTNPPKESVKEEASKVTETEVTEVTETVSEKVTKESEISNYSKAGVNIESNDVVIKGIKESVESTFNDHVLRNYGGFGGLYSLDTNSDSNQTVLVASTDGVGTKSTFLLKDGDLPREDALQILGESLVNHCINDILVQGANPIFFLDYFATSKLNPNDTIHFVKGVSKALKVSGAVLLGGETAEMPGVYVDGECDFVGTIVGTVKQNSIISGQDLIKPGDLVYALPSIGPHTNGYSLIRSILDKISVNKSEIPELVLNQLQSGHKSYLQEINGLQKLENVIHGLCHVTGGGLVDNPLRIMPRGLVMKLDKLPELPEWCQYLNELYKSQTGSTLPLKEMRQVFNCGIGMLIVMNPSSVQIEWYKSQGLWPEEMLLVGEIIDPGLINQIRFD